MKVLGQAVFLFALLAIVGCGNDDGPGSDGQPTDNFDRSAMLTAWVDQFILPAYANFLQESEALKTAAEQLQSTPDMSSLVAVRTAFTQAYRSWQKVSIYQIGHAEAIGLREQINTYPTEVDAIEDNVMTGDYNLNLPSEIDRQGFPALDYLLFGSAANEVAILDRLINEPNLRAYIVDLSARIDDLAREVNQTWLDGAREEFIQNSGSSATASVDRFVNDFIFYYEKFLRAGKIGIPAGIFSGNELPTHVEARHNREIGRTLAIEALNTVQSFFNGETSEGTTNFGLADYLDYLNTVKNGEDLSQLINDQLNTARENLSLLSEDLENQVATDNIAMLAAYDELQKVVVLIKVDMLQALNVSVDFVDADGD